MISHTLSPIILTPTFHGQQYLRDEENFELKPRSVDSQIPAFTQDDPLTHQAT